MERTQLRSLILAELCQIAPEIDPGEVPEHEDLRDALDLDSMDYIRLLTAVDKRLGVTIPEADYGQIATLASMLDYLAQRAG